MRRRSMDSRAAVMNTEYVLTVGEAVSSLRMVSRCFLPSAHMRPLVVSLRLWFTVIIASSARRRWSCVNLVGSCGVKATRSCICLSSLAAAAFARSLEHLTPATKPYWVITIWVTCAHCRSVGRSPSVTVTRARCPVRACDIRSSYVESPRSMRCNALRRIGRAMAVGWILVENSCVPNVASTWALTRADGATGRVE